MSALAVARALEVDGATRRTLRGLDRAVGPVGSAVTHGLDTRRALILGILGRNHHVQRLGIGHAHFSGARVQVEHEVARRFVELNGLHHRVSGHDFATHLDGAVVTARDHTELHEQQTASTFRDGTLVVVVGNPPICELHVVIALLGDRETVVRGEVVLGGTQLVVDPRHVAELVDHLVVAIGAVEIALAYHLVLLGFALEGGVGTAVESRVGILDALEHLCPIPAHAVVVDAVAQTRGSHLRDEVAHRRRRVGLAVHGYVRGEHLGKDGSAVVEILVTHVTLGGHERGLQSFRIYICVFGCEERERLRVEPALVARTQQQRGGRGGDHMFDRFSHNSLFWGITL